MVIAALKELAPAFLKTTLVFGGRVGPVHGYGLPSNLASHTSFWSGILNDSPSPPEAGNSSVSGELIFKSAALQHPQGDVVAGRGESAVEGGNIVG